MATSSTNLGRVSLVPRGEYDPAAQYERLDLVRYNGSGYLVLRPVQGVTPVNGADYMLISEKGGKGDKGDLGSAAGFGAVSATVDGSTGAPSVEVSASGPDTAKEFAFSFHGLKGQQGIQGDKGDPGSSIASIERTAGTGAPGTRDTYTITLTDGTTSTFQVYNGADGVGAGDMTAAVYDPQGKAQDIFQYVDDHTPKDAVTVPGGGAIEMGEGLGEGPYTFEFTPEEDDLNAEQVSYDGSASGLEAVTVQGALDALNTSKADRNRVSNRNLLDNGYLAAPVNQRGQTEYTGNGYAIDRWRLYGSGIRCVLNDNYLSITATADNNSIGQTIESERILFEQVTFSCLRSDGTLVSGTGKIPSTATDYHSVTLYSDQTMSLYIQYLSGKMLALIGVKNNNTVNAVAVKLELGPVQTLAHKEGNTWVLNDPPPDPALELAKCNRYYQVIRSACVAIGSSVQSSTYSVASIPFGTMRTTPAASFEAAGNGHIGVVEGVQYLDTTDVIFSFIVNGQVGIQMPTTVAAGAAIAGKIAQFHKLVLNAEL